MPREFYTEKDIEDLFRRGVSSLEVRENAVLTELAYERARSIGMRLIRDVPDNPPSAPMRPYLSQKQGSPSPIRQNSAALAVEPASKAVESTGKGKEMGLEQRIRGAVIARLGTRVDSGLLDVIIKRVLHSTGMKEQVCCSAGSGAQPCVPSNAGASRG